jgi:hypothetical protein
MNLREAILKEHSKKQCLRIVNFVGNDTAKFRQLMDLFFTEEYRVSQRASWPMSCCVCNHPRLITPYLGKLIGNLQKKGHHDAILRNTLRLLQEIEVPRRHHGKLMSTCFDLLQEPAAAVAIKAFALTVLHNLSRHYPEILPELRLVIEENSARSSPAFRSRARRII